MKKVLATLLSAAILCGGYATNVKARHTEEHTKNNGKQNHCSSCGFSLFKSRKCSHCGEVEPKGDCGGKEEKQSGRKKAGAYAKKSAKGNGKNGKQQKSCQPKCKRCGSSNGKQEKSCGNNK